MMKRPHKLITIIALFILPLISSAQENSSSILTSTMFGVGSATIQDTYLSPLYYEGAGFQILHERVYSLPKWGEGFSFQQFLKLNIASTENPAQNNTTTGGTLSYQGGVLYKIPIDTRIKLYAGGQAEGVVGFIHNQRNGNNPATAKVMANLRISAMATYQFNIKEYPILLRASVSTPFAGVYFAPKFGQSYYEIFGLGNKHGVVKFGSFHNHTALNGLFTVDLPIKRSTIRLGYLYDGMKTEANYISTLISTHSLLIGYAKSFTVISPKRRNRDVGQIYY
ncbi:MAG: DUF3316 domain-containing protein [Bacteroidales bacterium]